MEGLDPAGHRVCRRSGRRRLGDRCGDCAPRQSRADARCGRRTLALDRSRAQRPHHPSQLGDRPHALDRAPRYFAQTYLQGALPTNPLASPLYARLKGLPSLLIQVGANEILRDDATRLADRALQAGVDVSVEVYSGQPHAFQLFEMLPEAAASVARIGAYIKSRTVLGAAAVSPPSKAQPRVSLTPVAPENLASMKLECAICAPISDALLKFAPFSRASMKFAYEASIPESCARWRSAPRKSA